MMYLNRMIALAAVFFVIIDFIWFFVRGKKNGFADRNEISTKKTIPKVIGIYILSFGIIALAFFREFGGIGDVVFCGCGVLGVELANRQLLGIDED